MNQNVWCALLCSMLACTRVAVADTPLTAKERTDAAADVCRDTLVKMNAHLTAGRLAFRPKVVSVREMGTDMPGYLSVKIAGGDRHKTTVLCLCYVRDGAMRIDAITFSQPTKPAQNHPSRGESVQQMRAVLQAWATEFQPQNLDGMLQAWDREQEVMRKIGGDWKHQFGATQLMVTGAGMTSLNIHLALKPTLHRS